MARNFKGPFRRKTNPQNSGGFNFRAGDRGFGTFDKEDEPLDKVAQINKSFDDLKRNPGGALGKAFADLVGEIGNAIADEVAVTWDSLSDIASYLDPATMRLLLRFQNNPLFDLFDLFGDPIRDILDALEPPFLPPPTPTGSYGLSPPLPGFDKFPTRPMCDEYRALGGALNVNTNRHFCWMQRRRYVDHRQQYEGRAVAQGTHPWFTYLETDGANTYYSYWVWNRETEQWDFKICTCGPVQDEFWLNWTWGGPPPDVSDLTAGQYMITWATWATYFLTYGGMSTNAWPANTLRQIPCELGDHKDSSLTPVLGGATPGPGNPYGPEGCLRGLACNDDPRISALGTTPTVKADICLACEIILEVQELPAGVTVSWEYEDPDSPFGMSAGSRVTPVPGALVYCLSPSGRYRLRYFLYEFYPTSFAVDEPFPITYTVE